MSVESVIYTKLAATSALTALLAAPPTSGVGASVYRGHAPQGAEMPFITFRMISNNALNQSGGAGIASGDAVFRSRYQFDIWARKHESTKLIADQLRAALDGWATPGSGGNPAIVGKTMLELEQDTIHPPPDDSDVPVFQVSMDFMLHWKPADEE